ncbi:hypothetical protein Dsin_017152 [Dipteronia sinensis]|uniref:Uncharacterized protein n=1 Tax=Dipteronia sinensis TaxID=43782 RepID=A0AAE0AF01_9ROSI|nr:hypothetical protein Dsin_017152 [Dipteronia sinensis]
MVIGREFGGLRISWIVLWKLRNLYWRQRSRIEWLKCGDRNTRFFHMNANGRRARNIIKGLMGDDGRWYDTKPGMEKIIQDYFSTIFQTTNPTQMALENVLNKVHPKLSPCMK